MPSPSLSHTPVQGAPAPRVALLLNSPKFRFVVYEEIWEALADSLRQAGATVRRLDLAHEADPDLDDLILIVGTPNYILNMPADLAALRARHGSKLLVFLWFLEWLPDPDSPEPFLWIKMLKKWNDARLAGGQGDNSGASNYMAIRQGVRRALFDYVFVFTPRKTRFLQKHGIPCEHLPVGHHPIWGDPLITLQEAGSAERDIDVLFLGAREQNRRGRIVEAVRIGLEKAGVTLSTMYDFNADGLWGEERNAILRRTKIYLSVYRHARDFSGTRFCLGMGNGALVVSEPVPDPFPFVSGEHFAEAVVPELAATILRFLQDAEGRQRLCRQAAELLIADYTMAASARRILSRAQEMMSAST